jgi:DNA-binding SARP family transcriptional activator
VVSRMWPLPDLLASAGPRRTGIVAEALAAYERLRVLLREELGVNPSQAVQDAHTKLLT